METRLEVIERAALLAEELGYEFFAVPEGWGLDSMSVLAHLAARTSRIKLAATVLSVWGRSAGTIAMGAATLSALSNGRFILGLGASTPGLAEGFHDAAFEQPVAKLSQTTSAVRALLSGERVPLQRSTDSRPLRLGLPPAPDVPIWHGTVGPRAVRLTAELADGWLPSWAARDGISAKSAEIAEHRRQKGARQEPLVVVAGPMVQVDDDPDAARRAVATTIAWYMCSMGELHPGFVASQGLGEEIKAVQAANPKISPTTGVIPPEAERLFEQFAAAGTPAEVRAQLEPWEDKVDLMMIGLPAGSAWPDLERTLRTAAP